MRSWVHSSLSTDLYAIHMILMPFTCNHLTPHSLCASCSPPPHSRSARRLVTFSLLCILELFIVSRFRLLCCLASMCLCYLLVQWNDSDISVLCDFVKCSTERSLISDKRLATRSTSIMSDSKAIRRQLKIKSGVVSRYVRGTICDRRLIQAPAYSKNPTLTASKLRRKNAN